METPNPDTERITVKMIKFGNLDVITRDVPLYQ